MIAKSVSLPVRIVLISAVLRGSITFAQQTGSNMNMDTYTEFAASGVLVLIVILFILLLYFSGVISEEEIAKDTDEAVGPRVLKSKEKLENAFKPTITGVYFVLLILILITILILGLIAFS